MIIYHLYRNGVVKIYPQREAGFALVMLTYTAEITPTLLFHPS